MTTDWTPPTPDPELERAVADALPQAVDRVFPLDWRGERLWIKRPAEPKRRRLMRVLRVLARLAPIPYLRPTASRGGPEALADEARRIAAVAARGARVPAVVGVAPGWLALGDLGPTVKSQLDAKPAAEERDRLIALAAKALAGLHREGGWHGRGLLNDFTLAPDGEIGLIDFEEDAKPLPLAARQARDAVLLATSAARYGADAPLKALRAYVAARPPEAAWTELRRLARLTARIRRLFAPALALMKGRDLRLALAASDALVAVAGTEKSA